MNKVIEELDNLIYGGQENPIVISFDITKFFQVIGGVRNELQRLDDIDNANPSKALRGLENMIDTFLVENKNKIEFSKANNYDCEMLEERRKELKSYKQALIKSQEQEKVLEIIKKKCLYNDNLNYVATCINYDMYKEKMREVCGKTVENLDWNDKVLLDYLKLFTQEEFDLLKRYCNKKDKSE